NALESCRVDFFDHRIEFLDALPCLRRNENDRSKGQELQFFTDVFLKVRSDPVTFLHDVPLIYNNNDGTIRLVGIAADMRIDCSDALSPIYKKESDIAFLQMTPCHNDAELFSF